MEIKNWTHVRQWLGFDRYDNFAVLMALDSFLPLKLSPFLNFFSPAFRLVDKVRSGSRLLKVYDTPRTPYARVMDSPEVPAQQKERLRKQRDALNPFRLRAEIDRELRRIEKLRRAPPLANTPGFPYPLTYPQNP